MNHALNSRALLGAFGFVLIWWLALNTAAAQTETTPPFMPTMLETGTPVQDQFEGAASARLYAFNGSADDLVNIGLHGDMDAYLVLLGDRGQVLTYDDDSGEAFGAALIQDFSLPYAGRYYVLATSYDFIDGTMVSDFTLEAPQAYELVLSGNSPIVDSAADVAPLVATAVAAGDDLEHALDAEQPIGYFTFEGAEGETVSLDASSESSRLTPIIHLFAPDGTRIAMSETLDGSSSVATLGAIPLMSDGQYLFMVMDVFFVDRLKPNAGDYGLGKLDISATID